MKRRIKAGKIRNSGFSLNVMTDDEVHEIHLGTLEILKDVGVFVENEEALERFDGGGCDVDRKNRVVRSSGMELAMALRVAPLIPRGTFLPRKSEAISKPCEERQIMMQLIMIYNTDSSIFPKAYSIWPHA